MLGKGGLNALTKGVREDEDDFTVEAIKGVINDCYLTVAVPCWLVIDFEETCHNLFYADGYGHTFSGYDHSEEEFTIGGVEYYAFRTN